MKNYKEMTILILIVSMMWAVPGNNDKAKIQTTQYTQLSPISIDGNTDFNATADVLGWPGNGSSADPFVISGIQMLGNSTETLLSIQNTDLHFIISDSHFNGSMYGIYLSNVDNGHIMNNLFTNNEYGMAQYYGSNQTINSNTFVNNTNGLLNSNINRGDVNSNIFTDNGKGIFHYRSYNTTIQNNIITGSDTGIYMESAREGNHVMNNTVNDNSNGILSFNSGVDLVRVHNNIIFDNFYGFWAVSSSKFNVYENTIHDNDIGIYFDYGSGNNASNNKVFRNRLGILLDGQSISGGSPSSNVWGNTVYENTEVGISANGGKLVKIWGNEVFHNFKGIKLYFGSSPEVHDNSIHDNLWGISLESVDNPVLYNHDLIRNGFLITLFGGSLVYLKISNFGNNTVNGLPIAYFYHTSNISLSGTYGQIILVNVSSSVVSNANVSDASAGVLIIKSYNITVADSYFSGGGVDISDSANITVARNSIKNAYFGVQASASDNVTIDNNLISNNVEGIDFSSVNNVVISNNTVSNSNNDGIKISSGSNIQIINNYIDHNGLNSTDLSLSALGLDYYYVDLYNPFNGIAIFFVSLLIIAANTIINNFGFGVFADGSPEIKNNDFVDNGVPSDIGPVTQLVSNDETKVSDNFFQEFWNFNQADEDNDGYADEPYIFSDVYNNTQSTVSLAAPNENLHWLSDPRITNVVITRDSFGVSSFDMYWDLSKDSSDHEITYSIAVYSSSGIEPVARVDGVSASSITVNTASLPTGVYFAHVTAIDSVGALAGTMVEIQIDNDGRFGRSDTSTSKETSIPTATNLPISYPEDLFETTEAAFLPIPLFSLIGALFVGVIFLRRSKRE